MRRKSGILLAVCLILAAGWEAGAQITIDQSDMPVPGDTLRVSLTNQVPEGFAAGGPGAVWDFSALQPLSQRIDTFVTVNSTPAVYQFFFVLGAGANLASPRAGLPFPGLELEQGFAFFKNTSSSYSELGSAYTFQGLPVPARYDNPDTYYQFPMTPGSTWSSVSSFNVSLPGMLYYSTRRDRSSQVDGWGTVTTPLGVFQSLRVKSSLLVTDSLYIDSLGTGFPLIREITEYKWLAKGSGIPVVQVNEEGPVVTAVYRDIPRLSVQPLDVSLGPDTAVNKGSVVTIRASISGGTPPYQILWNTLDTGLSVTATILQPETFSVVVVDALQNFGFSQRTVSVIWPPGVPEWQNDRIRVFPNPSEGKVTVLLHGKEVLYVDVLDAFGRVVRKEIPHQTGEDRILTLDDMPSGSWLIRAVTGQSVHVQKLVVY